MGISCKNFPEMIFYYYKYSLPLKQCIDWFHLAFGVVHSRVVATNVDWAISACDIPRDSGILGH